MGAFKNEFLQKLYAPMPAYDASFVDGQRILVTGAGGSIGSVICKELMKRSPDMVAMLDAYDGNLYNLANRLNDYSGAKAHRYIVGSVRERQALHQVFREIKPTMVFHAAALKHVPMLEDPLNLLEAAHTNVLGTYNVALECLNSNSSLVNISTDKAVRPVSVLGLTKRCAELYVQDMAKRLNAPLASVRFGNVLDSLGSALPHFKNQILTGGPVTVTHPDMTRFFMTLEQASALTILTSGLIGEKHGAFCYMLEMGDQVKITDIVMALIDEYGETGRIGTDITGIRPGEKLTEELRYPWEKPSPTKVPGVYSLSGMPEFHAYDMEELRWAISERRAGLASRCMATMVHDYSGDFSA